MGYYTQLELETHPYKPLGLDYLLKKHDLENKFGEECKWYDYESDMIFLSREMSDTLFILTGSGEDPNDMWRQAFFNGKIVWDWSFQSQMPQPPDEVFALVDKARSGKCTKKL